MALRAAMSDRGITQAELARRTGESQPSISLRMSGRVGMTFHAFEQTCAALDLDPRAVLRQVTGGYQGWVAA